MVPPIETREVAPPYYCNYFSVMSGIPFDVSCSEAVVVVDVKFLSVRVPSP